MESMAPDTEALCRCGGSTRPFCGGTHAVIGMCSAQKAVRREEGEV